MVSPVGKTTVARITVADHDETASDDAAQKLRLDLRELEDVVQVEQATRPGAPDGARSGELIAIGTLIVTLAAQLEAVAAILTCVAEWRRRHQLVEIRVEIDGDVLVLTGADEAQVRAVIEGFLEKRRGPDA